MTNAEFIKFIAALAQKDMSANGVLASVTIAQAILESGYGTTELAVNANNYFGMKCSLSGNTWAGSTWDGVSKYTKTTQEQDTAGNVTTITADFRKYSTAADSVGDHSAYLLGAMNGSKKRYAGLQGETDPQTAITIIKNGGYATDVNYVSKVMAIITQYNLTQYDTVSKTGGNNMSTPTITQKTGTTNTTASAGRTISYIVIHYTAGVTSASGAAANTAAWFAQSAAQASADFIVDDENIVQYNPDPKNRYCWAVGGSNYNNKGGSLYGVAKNANCVSVEICSTNSTGKVTDANDSYWSFTDAVLENAATLVKYLMTLYGISADHVIRHYDVNGKPCPGIKGWNADSGSEAKWTAFKAKIGATTTASASSSSTVTYYRVRKTWADASSQIGAYTSLDNAKACADAHSGYYVFDSDGNAVYPTTAASSVPYQVKVTISDLNIRKGPGTNYDKTGKQTGKGVFTITEEATGQVDSKGNTGTWGKLKSGLGWICLSYTTKV